MFNCCDDVVHMCCMLQVRFELIHVVVMFMLQKCCY